MSLTPAAGHSAARKAAERDAYRQRERADDHDSARQSEKERADYAEQRAEQAERERAKLVEMMERLRAELQRYVRLTGYYAETKPLLSASEALLREVPRG